MYLLNLDLNFSSFPSHITTLYSGGGGGMWEFLLSMLARASFSKLYEYEQAKNGLV